MACPACQIERTDYADVGDHLEFCPNCGSGKVPYLYITEYGKMQVIKNWLRVHSDYGLSLEFHGIHGNWVTKLTHHSTFIYTGIGVNLGKQLENVIKQLKSINPKGLEAIR